MASKIVSSLARLGGSRWGLVARAGLTNPVHSANSKTLIDNNVRGSLPCGARWHTTSSSGQEYSARGEETEQERADKEEQIREELLDTALEYVVDKGWTKEALAAAAADLGLPTVSTGLVQGGGATLVLHHISVSNRQLDSWMSKEAERLKKDGAKLPVAKFVRGALVQRLGMNAKFILANRWAEAIALTANPVYCKETTRLLQELCDDIWYRAGDTSTDVNWYTKRISVAAIYAATEVFMLQDTSQDFRDTWAFLDRRLADIQGIPNLAKLPADVMKMVGGAVTTAKNIAGLQR